MKMMYSEYLSLIRKVIECIEHQEKATPAILMTKVKDNKLNLLNMFIYFFLTYFINLYLAIRCLHFFKRIKKKKKKIQGEKNKTLIP